MAKFETYGYRQRVFLPVSPEDQLMPETLGFAIHTLVATRLDTSGFEQRYRNDETGRSAYAPKILLKLVRLGYARGLISSRKIEHACRETWSSSPWLAARSPTTAPLPRLYLP
jgi:transposase